VSCVHRHFPLSTYPDDHGLQNLEWSAVLVRDCDVPAAFPSPDAQGLMWFSRDYFGKCLVIV
jgi:hypothetical protein